MKLHSINTEKLTIKMMLKSRPEVANYMAGRLNPEYFSFEPAREVYERVSHMARRDGEVMSWQEMLGDPVIPESTRNIFSSFNKTVKSSRKLADSLINQLNDYRRARHLFYGAEATIKALQRDKVDIRKLIDESAESLTRARADTDQVATVVNYSKGAEYLVKKLLEGKTTPAIPTGIKAHDDLNAGWFYGSLVILAGTSGGGKCLVGESVVPTDQGLLTLEELCGPTSTGRMKGLNVGVFSQEGQLDTNACYKTEGATVKVTLSDGTVIEGLPEHKMWACRGGVSKFRKLGNIRLGDTFTPQLGTRLFGRYKITSKNAYTLGTLGNLTVGVRCAPEAQQIEFLRGLFSRAKVGLTVSCKLNPLMTQQVKVMLANIGIASRIQDDMLHIASSEFTRIGFTDRRRQLALSIQAVRQALRPVPDEPVTVVGKSKGRKRAVYDLSVPGPHSYAVQGFMGHNSALALNIGKHQAEYGARVVLIPLEMSESQTNERLMACLAQVPMTAIIRPHTLTVAEKKRIAAAFKAFRARLKQVGGEFTIWKPHEDMTIEDMLFHLRPLGYNVIYVDYVGLLKGTTGDNQARDLGAIARFCKIFADRNNCIVVLLAQLDDESDRIRYSRAMQEHACVTGDTLVDTDLGFQRIDAMRTGESAPHVQKVVVGDKLRKTSHWHNNGERPICELTLKDGRSIRNTWDHKFLVLKKSKLAWTPACDLVPGDMVALSTNAEFPNKPVMFGAQVLDESLAYYLGRTFAKDNADDRYRLPQASIPIELLQSPREVVRAFLQGTAQNVAASSHFSTLQSARRMQLLQDKLGYFSEIVQWNSRFLLEYTTGKIPTVKNKRTAAQIENNRYRFVEVESVVDAGTAPVFDITVPLHHNYVANGIVSHNSNAWYWNRDKKSKETHILHIRQRKARNQSDHSFDLMEDFAHMRVGDVHIPNAPSEPKKTSRGLGTSYFE